MLVLLALVILAQSLFHYRFLLDLLVRLLAMFVPLVLLVLLALLVLCSQ